MNEGLEKYLRFLRDRLTPDEYLDICFWNDQKRDRIIDTYYKKDNIDLNEIEELIVSWNQENTYAAGYMLNPLNESKRDSKNVSRILNVAIDIDKGNDISKYNIVLDKLTSMGIQTSLTDKSQNGFHFVIPVEMSNTDSKVVERFLKGFKEHVHEDVDTIVFDLPRFFRLPETINNKSIPGTLLETMWMDDMFNDEMVQNNTRIIREYAESVELKSDKFESIVNSVDIMQEEPDVFFDTILKSKELQKYIADKDGIEKNNILFKNIAIYLKSHEEAEEEIHEFVKLCDHSEGEFYGWVKKDMLIVNYSEIRKWIFDYDLDLLKPIIKEQLKISVAFLENFQMCYIASEKTHRYMIYDKRSGGINRHTESQLSEFIKYLSFEEGVDIYSEFNISRVNPEGEPLSQRQLLNKIQDRMLRMFQESDILKLIDEFGYKPTEEKFFEDFGRKYFNTYSAGPLENYFVHKDSYEFPYIEKLLKHLTNSEAGYEYLNKWLSFILVNPLVKLPSSIIFKGTQGTGKGRFREWILPSIWGNHNIEEINDTNLKNIWGDYVKNNRIVIANEINLTDSGSNSAYKRIKEYSTDKEVSIQQKGKPLEKIHNYSHWLFFSDQEMPVKLDAEDRRHTIFHQETAIPPAIVMELSPDINPGKLMEEMREYVSYLRTLEVKFEEVYKFLPTDSKDEIIQMSKDTVDSFLEELKDYETMSSFCIEYGSELAIDTTKNVDEAISSKDLYDLYYVWADKNHFRYKKSQIGFGMKLSKEKKIDTARKRISGKLARYYNPKDLVGGKQE